MLRALRLFRLLGSEDRPAAIAPQPLAVPADRLQGRLADDSKDPLRIELVEIPPAATRAPLSRREALVEDRDLAGIGVLRHRGSSMAARLLLRGNLGWHRHPLGPFGLLGAPVLHRRISTLSSRRPPLVAGLVLRNDVLRLLRGAESQEPPELGDRRPTLPDHPGHGSIALRQPPKKLDILGAELVPGTLQGGFDLVHVDINDLGVLLPSHPLPPTRSSSGRHPTSKSPCTNPRDRGEGQSS